MHAPVAQNDCRRPTTTHGALPHTCIPHVASPCSSDSRALRCCWKDERREGCCHRLSTSPSRLCPRLPAGLGLAVSAPKAAKAARNSSPPAAPGLASPVGQPGLSRYHPSQQPKNGSHGQPHVPCGAHQPRGNCILCHLVRREISGRLAGWGKCWAEQLCSVQLGVCRPAACLPDVGAAQPCARSALTPVFPTAAMMQDAGQRGCAPSGTGVVASLPQAAAAQGATPVLQQSVMRAARELWLGWSGCSCTVKTRLVLLVFPLATGGAPALFFLLGPALPTHHEKVPSICRVPSCPATYLSVCSTQS